MQSQDRRAFFREVLRRVVEPAADFVEGQLESTGMKEGPFLRPPGALGEEAFLETCHRCGSCIEACPANAILPLKAQQKELEGTPYIDPIHQPCVVCDDLACMSVCPSGALQIVHREEIRIGLAVLNEASCIRTEEEPCRICADLCPVGDSAIEAKEAMPIVVQEDGCIGCGVCEHVCPTSPKSIKIQIIN
jgi:MauM/NapG family ferredoxin protein